MWRSGAAPLLGLHSALAPGCRGGDELPDVCSCMCWISVLRPRAVIAVACLMVPCQAHAWPFDRHLKPESDLFCLHAAGSSRWTACRSAATSTPGRCARTLGSLPSMQSWRLPADLTAWNSMSSTYLVIHIIGRLMACKLHEKPLWTRMCAIFLWALSALLS